MKRLLRVNRLIPLIAALAVLGAATAAAIAIAGGDDSSPSSADGIAEGECSQVHNIEACDDAPDVAGVCIESVPDCEDMIVVGDGTTSGDGIALDECSLVHNVEACEGEDGMPPIRSDEGIDPDECNYVHNIDACDGAYDITVQFNTSVSQDDIAAAEEVVRSYDPNAYFAVQESFPPTGRALVASKEADLCARIEAELEASHAIDDATCAAASDIVIEPDSPVTYP